MQCTCTGTNTGLAGCGMRVKVEAGGGMQIPWQVQDFLILTGGMCDSFKIEVGCKTDNHGLQTLICVNIPSGAGWLDLARNSGRMLNLKSLLDLNVGSIKENQLYLSNSSVTDMMSISCLYLSM